MAKRRAKRDESDAANELASLIAAQDGDLKRDVGVSARRAKRTLEVDSEAAQERIQMLGASRRRKPRDKDVAVGIRPTKMQDGSKSAVELRAIGLGLRRVDDPQILAAARRLSRDIAVLLSEKVATDAMMNAVRFAYAQAYGAEPRDTWRAILIGLDRPLAMSPFGRSVAGYPLHAAKVAEAEAANDRRTVEEWATARGVLATLNQECNALGVPRPPRWLDARVIGWLLGKFNPGGGGGRGKKLGEDAIDALLRDPAKLATAIEKSGTDAEFRRIANSIRQHLK